MIKKVKEYLTKDFTSISDYTDTTFEWVVMLVLIFWYVAFWMLFAILLGITCPIWIVPYLIYKKVKSVGGTDEDI